MTDREVMQQALEVLERAGEELRWQAIGQVQRDLRAALEQQQVENQVLINLLCRVHRDGGHYIAEHGLQKAIEDADIKIAKLNAMSDVQQQAEPDRRDLQAAGIHAAPCARHCEAKAFEIEIRSLKSALGQQQAEPVGEVDAIGLNGTDFHVSFTRPMPLGTKLYTAPPQRKPLTDEQPVSNADELPSGFVPLQEQHGRLVYAACMDSEARHYKWLMWRHPDGQWVSKRKLEDWEVMQVEDQQHYGIVQKAAHGIKEQP